MNKILGGVFYSLIRMAVWGLHVQTGGLSTKIIFGTACVLVALLLVYAAGYVCVVYIKHLLGFSEAATAPMPSRADPKVAAKKAALRLAGRVALRTGGKLLERRRNKKK